MINILNKVIGLKESPFVIAEMSANHNQSLKRAIEIVEAAAASGADALKLQTYTADTMTLDVTQPGFQIEDPNSLWVGRTLYSLYNEAHTPWEWHEPIFKRAKELGMIVFSTPFDDSSIDFLEDLDVPCYKIASFENSDLNLIRRVAATRKPLMISIGMASIAELDEAVTTARDAGCTDLILLKCTSTYPASPENSNLLTIPHLRQLFNCEVGLSDHTKGIGVSIASIALQATVIEKHFTLNRDSGGVDSEFSIEPSEMALLVSETNRAHQALGGVQYGPVAQENKSIQFRRSLYIIEDIKAGTILTKSNIRAIRPGYGLPIKEYDKILGRTIKKDAKRGTPLHWNLF